MPDRAEAQAVDEAARRAWSERILGAAEQPETLLRALEELDSRQDIATQAALFESVFWRAEVRHYWVFYRMARVYAELGRLEAGMLMAGFAARMQPDWEPTFMPYRDLFRFQAMHGMRRAALDVFEQQIMLQPQRPIAERHELIPLAEALGIELAGVTAGGRGTWNPASRRDSRVVEEETRPPTPVRAVGGVVPYRLAELERPITRPPIDVAELPDAELLIYHNAVAVRDVDGMIHADLSICPYPGLIARRIDEQADAGRVQRLEAREALLIADRFHRPNLAHFLLDQANRIELYRRAGADLLHAVVVGPALRTAYQIDIANRAGIAVPLDIDRVARVRVGRLWVSSECEAMRHPAYLGAGWAIDHARGILGGRGAVGRRKLYLSRADASTRQLVNEAALGEMLAGFGFETIVPGVMPYREQLEHMRTASHVIGVHGAALTHLLLCPPGTRVLEIFHPLYGTPAFAVIALACGLDYAALVGRDGVSDAPELNDPAAVDMSAGLFGERNLRVDLERVRAWVEGTA
jgi:capsular polysaccharide biosynthesis protein